MLKVDPIVKRLFMLSIFFTLFCHVNLSFGDIKSTDINNSYEYELLKATENLTNGNAIKALNQLDRLIFDYPESRASHLLRSDLLNHLAGNGSALEQNVTNSKHSTIISLRQQIFTRWNHYNKNSESEKPKLPKTLILLTNYSDSVLYVDLPSSRLYVITNDHGKIIVTASFYISIGKQGYNKTMEGDLRTPVGIYQINGYLPGEKLDSRYGVGAFTTNYPNEFDRHNNKTGHGIWIHGTEPGWINRGPRASEGCITLSNIDFTNLSNLIGTQEKISLIIDSEPEWLDVQKWLKHKMYILNDFIKKTSSGPDNIASNIIPNVLDNQLVRHAEIYLYPGSRSHLFTRTKSASATSSTKFTNQYWEKNENDNWKQVLEY